VKWESIRKKRSGEKKKKSFTGDERKGREDPWGSRETRGGAVKSGLILPNTPEKRGRRVKGCKGKKREAGGRREGRKRGGCNEMRGGRKRRIREGG